MKLANLNSAIRNQPGIMIPIDAPAGRLIVRVVKADLLFALKHCFNEDRNAETFLKLDEKGYLVGDGAEFPPKPPSPALPGDSAPADQVDEVASPKPESAQIDLEDLLGDGAAATAAAPVAPDLSDLLG